MKNHRKFNIINSILTAIIMACLLCFISISCTRVQYIPQESVKTDTLLNTMVKMDSIFQHDSIYIHEYTRGDTVYSVDVRYKYRDRTKTIHDTIYRSKTDSIYVPYPVERELSRWEVTKIRMGTIAIYLLSAIAILAAIRLIIHHHMRK